MSYTAQLDSRRLLGLSPRRLLLLPFAAAAAVGFPLVVLAGAVAAMLGGGIVAGFPLSGLRIGQSRFLYLALEALDPILPLSCLVKASLMGLAVASVGFLAGDRPVASAPEFGGCVTRAAVWATLAVVAVDVVVSFVFFTGGVL